MKIFNLFHEDLKLDSLPPRDEPVPVLLIRYWESLWKNPQKFGKEYLNPSNINIVPIQRIWEFIQIVASVCCVSNNVLKNKDILSLGAGFESCLYVFAKLGANVYASDIYFSPKYWYPSYVKYIKEQPEIFCHYNNFKPKIKYINVDLKSKKDLANIGKFDIIYSISSLEHIYSRSFRKKKKMFLNIIKLLKENGIFSFSTEIITKYDHTRQYKIVIDKFIKKLRGFLYPKLKENNNRLIRKKKITKGPRKRSFIKELRNYFLKIISLPRYNRRYDFYTFEELKIIINLLEKKKIYLVEKINWKSCSEFSIECDYPKGQYRTSITLTFSKDLKYKNLKYDLKNLFSKD